MFGSLRRGRTYLRIGEESGLFRVLKLLGAVTFLVSIPILAYFSEKQYRNVSESVHEVAQNVTAFKFGSSQAGDIVHLQGVNYTASLEDTDFKVTILNSPSCMCFRFPQRVIMTSRLLTESQLF